MKSPPRKLGITARDRIYMRIGNFTFKVRQGDFFDRGSDRGVTEANDLGIRPIWLGFVKAKGQFYVELTGLTTEELDLFERGVTAAIEAARQVVAYLDEHADAEYDDDTPLIPLRALRTAPPVVMRSIRPFIGTEMDPETTRGEKAYNAEMEQMRIF